MNRWTQLTLTRREYAITSTHLSGDFLQSITRNFADAGISGNLAETATAAPPELMHGLLDDIDAEYGPASASGSAVEAYLLTHGMDPATPERLRACLLEPADRYRGFGPVGPQGALS
jgi:protein-tyrosine phosphatase